MKVKNDFITNSSSVGYVISGPAHILKNLDFLLKKDGITAMDIHKFKYFNAEEGIEPLYKYHIGRKRDWIDKATNFTSKWGKVGNQEMFDAAKNQMLNNKSIVILELERGTNNHSILLNEDIDIIQMEDH